ASQWERVQGAAAMTNDQNPEEDFATLFAASIQTKRLQVGQTVEGTIVALGSDVALVDVGSKGEASLAVDELRNEEGVVEAKVGDRIEATVTSMSGGITLSRRLQRGAATRRQIEDAFRSGLPIEGKVDAQVKGGFTVSIARQRAFCPQSQIDTARDTDPATHLGRVYTFRIIEYREEGRKFVVSRRALLEEEQKKRAEDVRRALAVDAVVTGRVASVRDFGAFVDLGAGVQGLLHVSEMGWSRVSDPTTMFKPGDEITVKVLRIDSKDGEDKIALGVRQLIDDPWLAVGQKYPAGNVVSGRVDRVADFGVFVELEPGITGLVPASETGSAHGTDLKKAFPVGTNLEVIVLDTDASSRRMRLSIKAIADEAERAEVRDYAARSDTGAGASLGSLADKLRGALGGKK
ncbi:MAG TPA: S1 RNA-binding domain-containing protein, partial [Vicinamibacterales bacterium]|nr:S1 RNA-binding domain-containing protein [Vicinamibacterales bacterium]